MLLSLSIRNFAIIDRLDLDFERGLNVLTGETGAGKSIIMGALNVILGGRVGAEMVRGGADRASVDAVFDLSRSPEMLRAIADIGFDSEEHRLVLSREILISGKSSARVGGRPTAIAQLRDIGQWLVDLHGQHEHQSLLAVPRHLDMLDEWGGKEVLALRTRVGEAFQLLRQLEAELASLETDARERARLQDLYRYQAGEISDAALRDGEEEGLKADSRRLANAQKLAESAELAASGISGDGGVSEALSVIARTLQDAAALDEALNPISESVSAAMYSLQEAARDLVAYADKVEHDPERLQAIEERLELFSNLKRKYGVSIADVIEYGRQVEEKLGQLERGEERGVELNAEIESARANLTNLSSDLTSLRKKLGGEFACAVVDELRDLAMERTRYEVSIERGEPSPNGTDRIEFMISPNPGEPMRPLARIASGGEISRVMLAIKGAMARQDPLPTMVFDEIDVGVGGRTASVIAEKLDRLADSAQIICITHLPQIAGRANAHFQIQKSVEGGRTFVKVNPLLDGERVEELARMLGGVEITETAMRHAREMLKVG